MLERCEVKVLSGHNLLRFYSAAINANTKLMLLTKVNVQM